MRKKLWQTKMLLMAGVGMLSGAVMTAQAEASENLWEYETAYDDEDNIIYDFEEIEVTLPADWDGKYAMEEISDGICFSLQSIRDEYSEDTLQPYTGELFSLHCSQDYDFMEEPAWWSILGSSDESVYYLTVMQGNPYFGSSAEAAEEWKDLSQDISWIVEHAVVTNPGEGVADPDNMDDEAEADSEYILEDSSTRYLAEEELDGMNADELQMAINEIYARHHRKFVTKSIQQYFNSKSWYSGTVEAAKFDETSLNQYEGKNIALMIQCMNRIGETGTGQTSASGGTAANGTFMYATATVNIRSKASTAGSIMGIVPQGGSVVATGSASGGWIPVNYNGIKGYVSEAYLQIGTGSSSSAVSGGVSGSASGTGDASGSEYASTAEEYDALVAAGGSIVGTMTGKQADENYNWSITVQTDDGAVYTFVTGMWSTFIRAEVGDRVQVDYLGALDGTPQYRLVNKKATEDELASGVHSVQGTVLYEGNDVIGIQTEDGSSYEFWVSGCEARGEYHNAGDTVVIEYRGSLDAPEVVSVTTY